MSIVGPPSDADLKRMKCSDVMAPLLSNYIGRIRKANAAQQQALAAVAIPDHHQQQQQQQQQQQHQIISAKLRLKFKGASDVLLLMLQRLLSFDPDTRVSAGDAFVDLSSSPPPAASGSAAAAASAAAASPPRHRHPIDSSVEGGHKGTWRALQRGAVITCMPGFI
jgi:hypothetical protein